MFIITKRDVAFSFVQLHCYLSRRCTEVAKGYSKKCSLKLKGCLSHVASGKHYWPRRRLYGIVGKGRVTSVSLRF